MEDMNYENAVARLEDIVKLMENDELDIDQMSERLREAQQLIKLCKDKLMKTDEEIKKILADESSSTPKNTHINP